MRIGYLLSQRHSYTTYIVWFEAYKLKTKQKEIQLFEKFY